MNGVEQIRARLGERYLIERELGRGGMGAVYLARDVRLDRPVALKVLPAEFATNSALRERFLRETRTAASFSHPNIVPVYAVEEAEGLLAYAMAYVEGESVTERVKRSGPLSVRDAVRLIQDAGYALAYAHGRGVVHRDIKPDNIMIERATGRALVMDFGIARVIEAQNIVAAEGITRLGEIVGTPEYMSPEQATGDHVDGRSALYSLGLTAFFALTGKPAVSGDTTGKILARQITERLPEMHTLRSDLPAPLADAIDRCVAKDPSERFANAESLVETLDMAKLTGPEIPLVIRLLAQELGTLSIVLVGGAFFIFLLVRVFAANVEDSEELLLIAVILFGVLVTRLLQTFREAKRVVASGFTTDDVHRGLVEVVDEREVRRRELRTDAATLRGRRKTLAWAGILVVGAAALLRGAWSFRHAVANGHRMDGPGVVLLFSAMIMFGVSLPLLVRSPVRMPVGERLFRLVWLGPIGRAFLFIAGRQAGSRDVRPAATGTRPMVRPVHATNGRARTPQPSAGPRDRVAELEVRVAELERWRKEGRA